MDRISSFQRKDFLSILKHVASKFGQNQQLFIRGQKSVVMTQSVYVNFWFFRGMILGSNTSA